MKIRMGFVSNSSTSSFICNICGEIEADRDCCLSDFDMIECENGHIFHNRCAKKYSEGELETKESEYGEEFVKASSCPICSLKILTDDMELAFLRKLTNLSREDVLKKLVEEQDIKIDDVRKAIG